jgi:hypothetical protein
MNLLQLPISQRLLVLRQRGIVIRFDFEVEDVIAVPLGRTEGGEEKCRSQWFARGEVLDWKIFLCLEAVSIV